MSAHAVDPEKLYTYQEVAGLMQVCVRTVARAFKHRRKFRPTKNTVRIPGNEVLAFLQGAMSPELDANLDAVKGTKCPLEGV